MIKPEGIVGIPEFIASQSEMCVAPETCNRPLKWGQSCGELCP